MEKIYVASSWRNTYQEGVVKLLRSAGHEVYDFKEPVPGGKGFGWDQIDERWLDWTPLSFRDALDHPIAVIGYEADKAAIDWCTKGVLVLPSGRSAHLEAGWIGGTGKPVGVYMPKLNEPELMYRFFIEAARGRYDAVCLTEEELLDFCAR